MRGGAAALGGACWLLLGGGCGGASAPQPAQPPVLAAAEAEDLLIRADDARSAALAGNQGGTQPTEAFAGPSLVSLTTRVRFLRQRGLRAEVEPQSRRLVHLAPNGGSVEAVLEVKARERRLSAGAEPGKWAQTLRQWEVRISRLDGGWRIVEDHDLPPERWWPT